MMRKLYCVALTMLGFSCFAATTYTYTNDGLTWTYTLKSGDATLTGVTGSPLNDALVVPSSVTNGAAVTYPVVAIAANSFQGLNITGLKIADSVTTIGAGAFANCTALETVDMGNGVVTIANGGMSSYTMSRTARRAIRSFLIRRRAS